MTLRATAGDGAEEALGEGKGHRRVAVHIAEGRGGGHAVDHDDGQHARIGCREEGAARKGGVEEVLADAAVELLDNDDGEEVADHGHPDRRLRGQNHDQQQAGHSGGEIVDGDGFLQEAAVGPLKEHGGRHARHHEQERMPAVAVHAEAHDGQRRDDHVQHDALGVAHGAYLRLVCNVKDHAFFLFVHFLASFAAASALAFSLAALAWSKSFAVLKAWVSGILAGQRKVQLPHSMQSVT